MDRKRTRFSWLFSILMVAALVALPAQALAQDDLSQTYTTQDGLLTFNYPEGWSVVEDFGAVSLASTPDALETLNQSGALPAGGFVATILPPTGLVEQLALIGLAPDAGPEALVSEYLGLMGEQAMFSAPEQVTVGDFSAVRSSGTSMGLTQALYAVDLGEGGLTMVAAAAPDEATLSAQEPTLQAIIGSFNAQTLATPDETGSVVWQQQTPIEDDALETGGVNGYTDVVVGADDTIYALDALAGVHVYSPEGEYQGTLGGGGDAMLYFADLAAAPDGSLWGIDYAGQVSQVAPDGTSQAGFSVADAGYTVGFSTQIAVGPDGNLYVLMASPGATDVEQVGQVVVFTPGGEVVNSFELGREDYFYEARMTFGPDGNLYVSESMGGSGVRVLDPQGNPVREGIGASVLFVGPGPIAVGPDGSIYVGAAATGAVYHFGPDGGLQGRFGQSQFDLMAPSASTEEFPPFEAGAFYEISGLATLSDGDVIVADSNPDHAQLVRVSFD